MESEPREKMALLETAVPTIFPNCPSYMTYKAERPKRLEQKEEEMLQNALMMSKVDQRNTVVKFLVSNFQDLLNKIDLLDLTLGWLGMLKVKMKVH